MSTTTAYYRSCVITKDVPHLVNPLGRIGSMRHRSCAYWKRDCASSRGVQAAGILIGQRLAQTTLPRTERSGETDHGTRWLRAPPTTTWPRTRGHRLHAADLSRKEKNSRSRSALDLGESALDAAVAAARLAFDTGPSPTPRLEERNGSASDTRCHI